MKLFDKLKEKNPNDQIQGLEYKHANSLRVLSLLLLTCLILTIAGTVFFVYSRVIKSINQVETIIILQSQLKIEPIDFEKLDKVEASWNLKHSTSTPFIETDPFNRIVEPLDETENSE